MIPYTMYNDNVQLRTEIERLQHNLQVTEQTEKRYAELARLRLEEIERLRKERDELLAAIEDAQDIASKALRKAWQLGQTYWQQADSEYTSQWRKADVTQASFQQLIDDTRAAIAKVKGGE
jgi:predicted nuclease with TOPRIM domain